MLFYKVLENLVAWSIICLFLESLLAVSSIPTTAMSSKFQNNVKEHGKLYERILNFYNPRKKFSFPFSGFDRGFDGL
jgi:hypothetical protein